MLTTFWLADFVSCRLIELLTGKVDTVLAALENTVFFQAPTPGDRAAVVTLTTSGRNARSASTRADTGPNTCGLSPLLTAMSR